MADVDNPYMCMQVDGLMWITNCVFQGAGNNSRAIDTNTINGGRPELYIGGAPPGSAWHASWVFGLAMLPMTPREV